MPSETVQATTAVAVRDLVAGYGKKDVLYGIDMHVGEGEVVVVLGHNGAGKTTLLKTIVGLIDARKGSVTQFDHEVTRASTARRITDGMWYIPSERFVFGAMSVEDNLKLGAASTVAARETQSEQLEIVYETFPALREKRNQNGGTLSGGQQRILSLGMALMAKPKILLLDEPSLGLAPGLVIDVMDMVRTLSADRGICVILVEQNIRQALRIADRAYVMRSGRIVREGSAAELASEDNVWELF
jgi:branched-chain amino acid transport system ATP-binding protein